LAGGSIEAVGGVDEDISVDVIIESQVLNIVAEPAAPHVRRF
jgi:hypothetical protein